MGYKILGENARVFEVRGGASGTEIISQKIKAEIKAGIFVM